MLIICWESCISTKLLVMATKQLYQWMSWYYYFLFFFTWTIIVNLIPLAVLATHYQWTSIHTALTVYHLPLLRKTLLSAYICEVQWPQMLIRKPTLLGCSQVQCTWDLPISVNESRFSYHHSLYPNLAKRHRGHIRSVTWYPRISGQSIHFWWANCKFGYGNKEDWVISSRSSI